MFRKTSILSQLIIGFSLIIILILSITSFFSYRYSSKVVVENTTQYLLESIVQMRGKTDVMLLEYDRLSQRVAFSPEIQQHFISIKRGESPANSIANVNRFVSDQSRYSSSNLAIHLVDIDGVFYSRNDSLSMVWKAESEFRQMDWYPSLQQVNGKMLWLSGLAWRNGTIPAVIGARQLNDWTTLERIGDMFLIISVDTLQRIIEENSQNSSRIIHVVDYRGHIVYSTVAEEIGKPMDPELFDHMQLQPTDLINWNVNDVPAYVAYSTSSYSGLTVVAYTDADAIVKELKKNQNSILIIGLFGIGAALLLTTFFSWSVAKPIRYLALRLNRVERGVLYPLRGRLINQEVAILFSSYNSMVEHLDETIRDLSSKQASEKQAQIIALKAQFRPHFLYNSLNMIYWTLMNDEQEKTAQMVLTLSDLMRYSIQPGSELVTLQEDIDQLNRYLLLQQARYGDKLQVKMEIDEELLPCRIMKMLLQPLVENAIAHGLESVKGRLWLIHIEIKQTNDHILLVVDDNGVGMTEDEMGKVLEIHTEVLEDNTMHSGLGLANLHQRIGLVYGKDYGIQLSRSSLNGLRVEIILPKNGGKNQ
ncbi:MAG: sensor histidine kinase [Paenibacillaceae bacterium]